MRVAIHQPEFIGWPGIYRKLAACDVFVLFDNVQYIKRGFTQRNRIKTKDGEHWLTVPVETKGRFDQPIRDVRIDRSQGDFASKHLQTLRHAYAKAPHRELALGVLESSYALGHDLMWELDRALLVRIAEVLGIKTRLVVASDLQINASATDQLIAITKAVGGTSYLSGVGGLRYMEAEKFAAAGVSLELTGLIPVEYPQLHGPFIGGLAIVDALAMLGAADTRAMIDACPEPAEVVAARAALAR